MGGLDRAGGRQYRRRADWVGVRGFVGVVADALDVADDLRFCLVALPFRHDGVRPSGLWRVDRRDVGAVSRGRR
jgi:hypothetical protein